MTNRRTLKKRKLYKKIDESELWDLGLTICNFILPRLEKFKNYTHSYPSNMSEKEWDDILNKIIWSFNYAREYINCSVKDKEMLNEENKNKYNEGMNLFKKYLVDLWD